MQLSCINLKEMKIADNLLENIRINGYRLTKVRKVILDVLAAQHAPVSVGDIQKLLTQKKLFPNKTTVYRELAFLKEQNAIRELQLGDSKAWYEIKPDNHHHHVVCVNCDRIEDVELKKEFLNSTEKKIEKDKKFKITRHTLE